MNSVLGFESGLIDMSVRNAVGSTLKATIPKTLSVAIVAGVSDTITFNYNNTVTKTLTFTAAANVA